MLNVSLVSQRKGYNGGMSNLLDNPDGAVQRGGSAAQHSRVFPQTTAEYLVQSPTEVDSTLQGNRDFRPVLLKVSAEIAAGFRFRGAFHLNISQIIVRTS